MKDFQLLIYSTPTEDMKVDVVLKDENIWATQKAMAALFGVQIPDISKHINNVFDAGELSRSTTVSKMETVVQRGFRGGVHDEIDLYNLDMIIAVGYRVSSARATASAYSATSTRTAPTNITPANGVGVGLATIPTLTICRTAMHQMPGGLRSFPIPAMPAKSWERSCRRRMSPQGFILLRRTPS